MGNEQTRQPARSLAIGAPSQPRPPRASEVEVPATLGASRRLGAVPRTLGAPAEASPVVAPAVPQAVAEPKPVFAPAPVDEIALDLPTALVHSRAAELPLPPVTLAPAVQSRVPAKPAAPVVTPRADAVKQMDAMHEELTRPLAEIVDRPGAQGFKDMFRQLVSAGVSDVHVRRSILNDSLAVEARVDGVMQAVHEFKAREASTIHTLLKTDSKMSSGVNIVPEDGSYEIPIDGYPYRARAAAIPLFDGGEKMTFRLPQTGALRSLDDLGFADYNLRATKELLDIPGGMVLFAGPTGEGKSTTSLSSLMYLRQQEDGVFITLEDPVERVIPGFEQVEVRQDVEGASFGDMMKYIVRSDPNVLFIGEIRDSATATAAVEIAKSGIRVIATIHAKDNISAFMRVTEMADAPPLSVLESVNGVASQRLVRRLVPGTDRFSGRYPIHEVTTNTVELTDALIANESRESIQAAASYTSTTFKQNVDDLIAAGITTLAEARKVVRNV
jgi:type II secretory ATPase GspE/PulE/Tfp pilus assembly ATPase PilB-like protein